MGIWPAESRENQFDPELTFDALAARAPLPHARDSLLVVAATQGPSLRKR